MYEDLSPHIPGITPPNWENRKIINTVHARRNQCVRLRKIKDDLLQVHNPRNERVKAVISKIEELSEAARWLSKNKSKGITYVGNYVDSTGKAHITSPSFTRANAVTKRERMVAHIEREIEARQSIW